MSPHGLLVLRLRLFEFDERAFRRCPLLRPSPNEFVIGADEFVHPALLLGDRTVIMTAQPGRIKRIIDVPFPHPRDLIALSASPEFGKLKLDIWRVLEDEVQRARAEMEG